MLIAIHGVKFYAHYYTWSEALCPFLYMELSEASCSMLYME